MLILSNIKELSKLKINGTVLFVDSGKARKKGTKRRENPSRTVSNTHFLNPSSKVIPSTQITAQL